MLKLTARRLAMSVPLVLVATFFAFLLEWIVPGDAALTIGGTNATPAEYAALRAKLGLNRPLLTQYWSWLDGAVHGNLGTSIFTGQSVTSELSARLPVTLSLVVCSAVVCAIVGTLLGTLSALRRGVIGRAMDAVSVVGLALPSFWVGLVLISVFAVEFRIFPATGYTALDTSPAQWARGLVLPVAALALGGITYIAKQTRDSMLEVLNRDFIRALRASGISTARIIWRHALKNAAIPVVTVLGIVIVASLSGTVLVEAVFDLPGLGSLAEQATQQHDLPVLEGIVLYFTLITVAVNLIVDLTYGWLNPKVRVK